MNQNILKRIAIIIAIEDFRDEEYFVTAEAIKKEGFKTKTVSTKLGTAKGADGGEVDVDLTLDDLKINELDVVIFIGGPGALEELDNEKCYNIAKEIIDKKKILAAICISPIILAKAGVLKNKKATVWTSSLDRQPIKILEENGAEFINEKVVQDENIITANGPAAASDFVKKIIYNLKNIKSN